MCPDSVDNDCDGSTDEGCAFPAVVGAEDYDAKLYGESLSDSFGNSLAGGFDFNEDGTEDIIVGATGDDDGGINYGAVYLYTGDLAAGVFNATTNEYLKFYGTSTYDSVGTDVWAMPDLDSDGDGEFFTYSDTSTHKAHLVRGPTGGSNTISNGDYAVHTCDQVAWAGGSNAVSGDDDWLCGLSVSSTATGQVVVYSGYATAAGTLLGETTYDYAGAALGV